MKHIFIATILLLSFFSHLYAGTTGKIAGQIVDATTGEPLPFANVIMMGTTMGAASDMEGYFTILNVPPGTFSVKASTMGYNSVTIENVKVEIDLTTNLVFSLSAESIVLAEDVVVQAEKYVIKKDVAANQKTIDTKDIQGLPVTTVNEVMTLQAGIGADLSVRGGDPSETLFLVDGLAMRDARTNRPISNLPLSAVQQMSVQTGGFSAEYANVRSGMVNVVTREGSATEYQAVGSFRISPPSQKHFGISPYDPNAYWLRPYLDPEVAMTGTESWDKYTARQYPEWNGWNAFAASTLLDDNPNNDLTAEAAKRIFEWQYRKQGDIKDPDYNFDVGFGGPVPFAQSLGNLRFFASFKREENQYLMELATPSSLDQTMMVKVTSDLSQSMKLNIIASYGETHGTSASTSGGTSLINSTWDVANTINSSSFTVPWRIHTNIYYSPTTIYNNMLSAKFTHVLSSSSFYEVQLKKIGVRYNTNTSAWRDTTKKYEVYPGYFADEAPVGFFGPQIFSIEGSLALGGAVSTSRDFTTTDSYSARFDFISQIDKNNQIKTGVEFVYDDYNMVFGSENFFLPEGNLWTNIHEKPFRGLMYVQDKMEFEGLVAQIGVIAEYSNPNGNWYDVDPFSREFFSQNYREEDEDSYKSVTSKPQLTFSPRIAISHPITVNSKLYFNYGHFYQRSIPENLYEVRRNVQNKLLVIGDPENGQARTVSYELGFDQAIAQQFLLRISGYYKDNTDQEMYIRYISSDGKVNYSKLAANNYEDIFGLEVDLSKMYGDWLTGDINFEYRVGSSGYFAARYEYENPADQREYLRRNPSVSRPRPIPRVKSWLDFHTPDNFGPNTGEQYLLGGWHFNFITRWSAGHWATWNPQNLPGVEYNVQWTDNWSVDLKMSKVFSFKHFDIKLFADIYNLFNLKDLSTYSFRNIHDENDYMYSLHLPENIVDKLGYENNIPGEDKPGDYRPTGVEFVPIEWVSNINETTNPSTRALYYDASTKRYMQFEDGAWTMADEGKVHDVISNKAYIDMPNQSFFTFLNPRNIFFGITLSYKL